MCLFVVMCMIGVFFLFFFKQKTAYEMRISDWSSDVCSSDLCKLGGGGAGGYVSFGGGYAGVEGGYVRLSGGNIAFSRIKPAINAFDLSGYAERVDVFLYTERLHCIGVIGPAFRICLAGDRASHIDPLFPVCFFNLLPRLEDRLLGHTCFIK